LLAPTRAKANAFEALPGNRAKAGQKESVTKTRDRFHLISLGCSKNTVDAESMAKKLDEAGLRATEKARQAEFLIVNTCGFIGPAREESIGVLRELAAAKRKGQMLIAAGCLSQRYGAQVVEWVPGVDGVIGTRRWMDIVDFIQRLRRRGGPEPLYHLPEHAKTVGVSEPDTQWSAVQGASAYLKIADGCRRPCAFCSIPLIKGTAVSRPVEALVAEARQLRDQGVRELILIAQDSTDYGYDLGLKNGLAVLLESLAKAVPDIDWIRLMYAYPGCVSDELIEVMASHKQIAEYLDIPLQHGDRNVLKAMRRPAKVEWMHETVEKMRRAMPEMAIRSTFIVGYPGEGEAEFENLLGFLRDIRFDRAGCFTFSFEPGTTSEPLGDPVPEEVKEDRRERLMLLQQQISLEKNQHFLGKVLPVLVEGCGEGLSVGRSYRDAPEVDGLVIIEGEVPPGEMVPVSISGAMHYDLSGTVETAGSRIVNLLKES
jgi:ribosomal protein S12 methylthiotransferase